MRLELESTCSSWIGIRKLLFGWSFLQGLLLFSLLAAWIISMKMDIPDTTSSIRQIRISDRDPQLVPVGLLASGLTTKGFTLGLEGEGTAVDVLFL